ncbi:hypothetical protein SCOR_21585 [Sulfidibacter corallicola]|uniref:Uncharacterized protein n=1 Tax=Sulfidibacter corallicola TaxID=2818388 RepID=A0A8A4TV24_SULCO|nr:hypothetical protein [Sulfidibacter corallicola]QTD52974.1 hypothetical protein J3U87_10960 [Sulfidibacter corallicola]
MKTNRPRRMILLASMSLFGLPALAHGGISAAAELGYLIVQWVLGWGILTAIMLFFAFLHKRRTGRAGIIGGLSVVPAVVFILSGLFSLVIFQGLIHWLTLPSYLGVPACILALVKLYEGDKGSPPEGRSE